MVSATVLKSSFLPKKAEWGATRAAPKPAMVSMVVRASAYADELVQTAKTIASPGRGILAMDESNATCGKRLASIGLENTEANRQAYRTLLVSAPGLGQYISGAILFEETLYQSTVDGKKIVDVLVEQGIVPGIKVDKAESNSVPLSLFSIISGPWCQGLDGLASREAAYYQAGARFAKWRTVVSIPNGPSELAVKEAAWGLARYAAISQDNGLVPIVEPEILLDGEHGIERTFEVAQKVWAQTFYYMAENNVMFEGILLKPSMVTPGAECKDRATPEQSPNPWHVSFSYARALQNTCLKTQRMCHYRLRWKNTLQVYYPMRKPRENLNDNRVFFYPSRHAISVGQIKSTGSTETHGLYLLSGCFRPYQQPDALLLRAKANSLAQLGKYSSNGEAAEAKEGMFVKNYTY
ncbi:hypothetical protein BS78_K331800 [Paspalum vaginatum]|uniref:Fructose-bisphosphate aldolase n=1 Tax=Paspalum vaginatum TaxID=158149 RepID=A0A9W7X9U9_9POAL|nr:hypothetical protein BS78_K331800 [Paspalum vaginatum]